MKNKSNNILIALGVSIIFLVICNIFGAFTVVDKLAEYISFNIIKLQGPEDFFTYMFNYTIALNIILGPFFWGIFIVIKKLLNKRI